MTQLLPSVFVSLASVLWWRVISTFILSSFILLIGQLFLLSYGLGLASFVGWNIFTVVLIVFLLLWQGLSIILRAVAIGDYNQHAPSIVRWVAVLFGGSSSFVPWIHTLGQVLLISGFFGIGIYFQIPQFQLSTRSCGKSILQAIRTDTDIFLSAEEFTKITEFQNNYTSSMMTEHTTNVLITPDILHQSGIDPELFNLVNSTRHTVPPRCIRADGFSLLFIAIVTTLYATLRWHAVGLSAVLSIPEKWGIDNYSSLLYWEKSLLPRNDLVSRLFQTLRITVRECIIVSFRPILIILGLQMIGLLPASLLIYLDYILRRLTILGHDDIARAVMLDDQAADDLLSSLSQTVSAIGMSIVIALLHSIHGTILPLFFSERFALNDFLNGIVGSPLQFAYQQQQQNQHGSNINNNLQNAHIPPTKFDMILSAMRVVYPRSVQHYMLAYPAHSRAEFIAAAGGTNVTDIGPNVTYVFPPWARREVVRTQSSSTGNGSTVSTIGNDTQTIMDEDRPTTEEHRRGLATSVKLLTWKPGTLILPSLGLSTARFKLDEASLIRAWQERLECGNWALWADKEVYGQYGSSKGSYGNRGYGRPLYLLSAMLRITSPGRALAEKLWFNYNVDKDEQNIYNGSADTSRNIALATTSPWLHILRDLLLCGGDIPLAGTHLERFGLVKTLQQLTTDLSASAFDRRPYDSTRNVLATTGTDPYEQYRTTMDENERKRIIQQNTSILSDFVLDDHGGYGIKRSKISSSSSRVTENRKDKRTAPLPTHTDTTMHDDDKGQMTLDELGTTTLSSEYGNLTSQQTTRSRVFLQSLGPQATDANDRISIFNDGLYRKWRDFLWTSTGLIDSTTIHLLAAAASDVLPVAANTTVAIATEVPPVSVESKVSRLGPLVPPATPLAPRKRAGTESEPVTKTTTNDAKKSSTSSVPTDEGGAVVRIFGTLYTITLRIYGLLTFLYGKIKQYFQPYVYVPFVTYILPILLSIGQYTGLTYVYELIKYTFGIILFQIRPYEAVVSAKTWFKTKNSNTNINVRKHKLPLSLDEIIGGSTLETRDAPRLTKVLISMVAPKVDLQELDSLSTSAVLQLQSSTVPKIFRKTRTDDGKVVTDSLPPSSSSTPSSSTALPFGTASSLGVHRLQESSLALPDSSVKRTFLFFIKRSIDVCFRKRYIFRIGWNILDDSIYAIGWYHLKRITTIVYDSIKLAAGVNDTPSVNVPLTSSVPHETSVDRSTTESFKLLRDNLRSSLTRHPSQDTADLLRDIRAITAVTDLLVSVVIGALRGEDRNLRQVTPTVPVVVYSIASCLAAAATYLSSPRYSATTVWTDPLFYRGTDAESIAIAQVEAALGNTLRDMTTSVTSQSTSYYGGSSSTTTRRYPSSSTTGPSVTPSMQVNLHPSKGVPYTEHVPCSARPTVAALISVLLHNLVTLFSQEANIPGMDVYMQALTFNAPSLVIKAVLLIANRRAKADKEEKEYEKLQRSKLNRKDDEDDNGEDGSGRDTKGRENDEEEEEEDI